MSVKKSKFLPRQQILEDFVPLNQYENEAYNTAINDCFYHIATTFTEQIGIICNYMRNEKVWVSYERIGKIFHKTRFDIKNHHKKYLKGVRPDGRPLSLTKEELSIVKNEILTMHSLNPPSYPTYEDILDFIEKQFNKNLRTDTLRKLLLLQLGEIFRPISAKPLDKDRNDVEVEQIDSQFNLICSKIKRELKTISFYYIF